ncbi:hypothetical protein GIB67_012777 [Kingdonia uniflora]|uniref:Aminotransferase-like plant mobile domain-containing protein n=1 Tax=Kingdonia uniflora TaxID=39325 RepID=A0A7J7NFV5_9MAGN|nr:hypothetical protein GIB67_012777 [Kingdonia uniflora]
MRVLVNQEPPTESAQAVLGAQAEFAQAVNIPQGLEFETESAQAALGAQPPLPNVSHDYDVNIPIVGGYYEGEGATNNEDVGPSDKSLLRSFRFHRARSIALGQSLKAMGTGNSLSLRKRKEHYAYKLEKVISDGIAAGAKKKMGLTARSVAHAYMLYVLGSFLFPTKNGTDVPRYGGTTLLKFREALNNYKLEDVVWDPYKDKRDSTHAFKEVTFFYGALASPDHVHPYYPNRVVRQFNREQGIPAKHDDVGIHQRKETSVNEHGDTSVHQSEDVVEQYDASNHEHASLSLNAHGTMQTRGGSGGFGQQITVLNDQLQKLKEDKEKESEANINLREALKEKCKESESLKVVNALLIEQIDLHLPPAIPPVLDATLVKKYDDLLSTHEDVKKKLIAKKDFCKKLVNAEERMKSLEVNISEWHNKLVNSEEMKKTLEVNNSEWEVWRQALKKALASEGMRDMGDPTSEELFEQNKKIFTIAQQGPKGDYQEDKVSTAVTLKNVVIARREKMAKKKKIQELLFQPWTKYLVDVRGVEISDNNFGFRVTAAI